MVMVDEAGRHAMEVVEMCKTEGIIVMPIAVVEPSGSEGESSQWRKPARKVGDGLLVLCVENKGVKITCGSSREPNTEKNTGLMESLGVHSTQERQRERDSKTHNSVQNNNVQSVHSMCSVNTFIQVHTD